MPQTDPGKEIANEGARNIFAEGHWSQSWQKLSWTEDTKDTFDRQKRRWLVFISLCINRYKEDIMYVVQAHLYSSGTSLTNAHPRTYATGKVDRQRLLPTRQTKLFLKQEKLFPWTSHQDFLRVWDATTTQLMPSATPSARQPLQIHRADLAFQEGGVKDTGRHVAITNQLRKVDCQWLLKQHITVHCKSK